MKEGGVESWMAKREYFSFCHHLFVIKNSLIYLCPSLIRKKFSALFHTKMSTKKIVWWILTFIFSFSVFCFFLFIAFFINMFQLLAFHIFVILSLWTALHIYMCAFIGNQWFSTTIQCAQFCGLGKVYCFLMLTAKLYQQSKSSINP
jgi:hypothetical protein